jgi:uncharacterized protein YdeI (YjbR/CyaY-like superfamily)
MTKKATVFIPHKVAPKDLKVTIASSKKAQETWESITPLAKNEWICLVTSAKMDDARVRRIERARSQLAAGQRRPCCWPGCAHR